MPTANYGLIQTVTELEEFFSRIEAGGKPFSFDIESGYDGPDIVKGALLVHHPQWKMVGFSFTDSINWARYVPVAHDTGENIDDVYTTAKLLWKLLQTGRGVAHNASFELGAISRWFRELLWDDAEVGKAVRASKGIYPLRSDTMIEAFMVQEYAPPQIGGPGIGLKKLTLHKYGHQMIEFEDLFPPEDSELGPKTPKAKMRFARFNSRTLAPKVVTYACEDSVWCLRLHQDHYAQLEKKDIFRCEILLLPVLCEMEIEGIELDWAEYRWRSTDTNEFLKKLNEEIQAELSERLGELVEINLSSPKQVSDMLYGRLGLPIKHRTKTDAPSTDEKALRALAKKDDVIKKILEYREVRKLLGSYIDKYLNELAYAADGRAHPNHNQTGAATGRFSVDHVSYQQWPKPYHFELRDGSTYDLNYRNFLIAPEGYRIVGYDFSQVELRVLAGMANEEGLLKAFADGTDIHKATASLMMGIPLDQVTDKDRSKGKTLNFAVVYGSGAANIGELLGISTEEAQALLDQYFKSFSGLKGWMDSKVQEGTRQGFVETLFGRKFKVWEFESHESYIHAKGNRMCVNAPVQGGAADYMKLGMVRVNKAIKAAGLQDKIRLVMTIHDALEFYVHESVSTQQVIDIVNPMVSFAYPGLPEIRADWHEGKRWGEVFEIDLDYDKQIDRYSFKQELPDKSKVKWSGDSFDEVYEQFEAWKKNFVYVPVSQREEESPAEAEEESAQDPAESAAGEPPKEFQGAPVTPQVARVVAVNALSARHMTDFAALMQSRPGIHRVVLQKPDGTEAWLSKTYDLTDLDQPLLSDILGGAKLHFEPLDEPVWA